MGRKPTPRDAESLRLAMLYPTGASPVLPILPPVDAPWDTILPALVGAERFVHYPRKGIERIRATVDVADCVRFIRATADRAEREGVSLPPCPGIFGCPHRGSKTNADRARTYLPAREMRHGNRATYRHSNRKGA